MYEYDYLEPVDGMAVVVGVASGNKQNIATPKNLVHEATLIMEEPMISDFTLRRRRRTCIPLSIIVFCQVNKMNGFIMLLGALVALRACRL